jgi:hypothetical protein
MADPVGAARGANGAALIGVQATERRGPDFGNVGANRTYELLQKQDAAFGLNIDFGNVTFNGERLRVPVNETLRAEHQALQQVINEELAGNPRANVVPIQFVGSRGA